jgi:hypothetical protein
MKPDPGTTATPAAFRRYVVKSVSLEYYSETSGSCSSDAHLMAGRIFDLHYEARCFGWRREDFAP